MKEYVGSLQANGLRFGIIIARFNELITRNLLSGAIDAFKRHGANEENITTYWVPGSFEIPLIAKKLANSQQFDAILCLGAVIRGATPHFDYVAAQVAAGISTISRESETPIIFGILTTNTIEEAIERAGTKSGNKGFDGAVSAIEMANLMRQISAGHLPQSHQCSEKKRTDGLGVNSLSEKEPSCSLHH